MTIDDPSATSLQQQVHALVRRIPEGRVVTYGQIAAWLGRASAARAVGRAMHRCPPALPWHRVIAAGGRLALAADTTAGMAQRRRLAAEGVAVVGGRVDLDRHHWSPAAGI